MTNPKQLRARIAELEAELARLKRELAVAEDTAGERYEDDD